MVALPSSGWQAFERLQHSLQNEKYVDAAVLADEEALTDLLDDFTSAEPPADEVDRRYFSLRLNRRRKYRARGRLLVAYSADICRRDAMEKAENPSERAEQKDLLGAVESKASPAEWAILRTLALGVSYSAIADSLGVTAGKVRTEVCRLREAIRIAVAAA